MQRNNINNNVFRFLITWSDFYTLEPISYFPIQVFLEVVYLSNRLYEWGRRLVVVVDRVTRPTL